MKRISALNGLRHRGSTGLSNRMTGGTLEEPRGSGAGGRGRRVGVLLDLDLCPTFLLAAAAACC